MTGSLQLDQHGHLRHLLSIDGLPASLLTQILDRASELAAATAGRDKKLNNLSGQTIVNLFFEPSTRTRSTFEVAAKRLSADVINLQVSASSTKKGETLLDTLKTMEAMQADMFVVRHDASGAAHFFAEHAAPGVAILNAGDGRHSHPTQGLLDLYTIRTRKGAPKDLSVAIVGDILHSRVARSDIHGLRILGCSDIRVIAPPTLTPAGIAQMGVRPFTDLEQGIRDVDVIILLRLQTERMLGAFLPSLSEFHRDYGLTRERLKLLKPDAVIMHPGPINRGVEISGELAYSEQSLILDQVSNGIAIRMAVMDLILGDRARNAEERSS